MLVESDIDRTYRHLKRIDFADFEVDATKLDAEPLKQYLQQRGWSMLEFFEACVKCNGLTECTHSMYECVIDLLEDHEAYEFNYAEEGFTEEHFKQVLTGYTL